MLRKIENREIMTLREAREKYSNNWFFMVTTQEVDTAYEDLGYVVYIGDSQDDLSTIDREEFFAQGKDVCTAFGRNVDWPPYGSGRVVYYD
ncbi:MAG: hypothetical protein LBE35_01105 [Clostridiales bacterium]|jgi:hypothetical protein|nr:hypothetical protein [Clostridiales bacterium]